MTHLHSRRKRQIKQSKYKLKIHKWACKLQTTNLALMVAHQAVAHAEIMYQWIESVRSQTMDQYLPGVQCDEAWLDLYRDHRKVTEAVAFIFEPEDMWPYQTKNVQQELDDSRFVSNWAKKQPEDFEAFIRDEFSPMNILQFLRIGIRLNHRRYKKQLEQLQETQRL